MYLSSVVVYESVILDIRLAIVCTVLIKPFSNSFRNTAQKTQMTLSCQIKNIQTNALYDNTNTVVFKYMYVLF